MERITENICNYIVELRENDVIYDLAFIIWKTIHNRFLLAVENRDLIKLIYVVCYITIDICSMLQLKECLEKWKDKVSSPEVLDEYLQHHS